MIARTIRPGGNHSDVLDAQYAVTSVPAGHRGGKASSHLDPLACIAWKAAKQVREAEKESQKEGALLK